MVFHKFDPDISNVKEAHNLIEGYKIKFTKILGEDRQIEYFETSIYNPITVISAISTSIYSKKNYYEIISNSLKEFCNLYNFSFAISFSQSFFEFGHHINSEQISTEELRKLIKRYFSEYTSKGDFDSIDLFYQNFRLLSSKSNVEYKESQVPFYLVIGFKDSEIYIEHSSIENILEKLNFDFSKIIKTIEIEELIK